MSFEASGVRCALPVAAVEEVSRPRAVTSLGGVPPYVLGTTRLRGTVTPLVDLGLLLTGEACLAPRRLVSLRVGGGQRRVALAVDSVQGLLELPETRSLPPLLSEAAEGLVQSLFEQDEELVAVLKGGNVLPAEVWKQLEALEGAEQ